MNNLLTGSANLEARLTDLFDIKPRDDSERSSASRILLSVAFEHAESLKMLIASGNFTSAVGLLRLQYEALVRAMWMWFAATEAVVSTLSTELTSESARRASNQLPMVGDMLTKLDGKAPQEAMNLLLEFKEYHWKPLSSYVHGGVHAMSRHSTGYPTILLAQLVKASNGVSLMAGMLLVILSADPEQRGKLLAIQKEFSGCLPDLKK